MSDKQLLQVAGVFLLVIGLMKINEPTQRTFDMNGILGFWGPVVLGGWIVYDQFLK